MKMGRPIYCYAKEFKLERGGKENDLQKHFRFDS